MFKEQDFSSCVEPAAFAAMMETASAKFEVSSGIVLLDPSVCGYAFSRGNVLCPMKQEKTSHMTIFVSILILSSHFWHQVVVVGWREGWRLGLLCVRGDNPSDKPGVKPW